MSVLTIYPVDIVGDDGRHYQFQDVTEAGLNAQIARWCRQHWPVGILSPGDDEACLETYFDNMDAHTLNPLDPIVVLLPDYEAGIRHVRELHGLTSAALLGEFERVAGQACLKPPFVHTYPIEVFVNGGLELHLDSADAEGDLKAIRDLLASRHQPPAI